ncbi:ribonuclease H-like domain-containing protein [Tanacetum coccineum]
MASRDQQWYMDTGAASHLSSHTGNLHTSSLNHNFHSIIVGNGSSIPVTHSDHGPDTAYLLLYVDDIILAASSTSLLQRIISLLHAEFAMTDLGPLNYFLGISTMRTTYGIFLTLIDTEKKLGPEGSPVTDPTLYRSLARSL